MSRMERYYSNSTSNKRTSRNRDLYNRIYDDAEYSNIEGIATIDNSKEVDIAKIKDMLRSRNELSEKRELKRYVPRETTIPDSFEQDDNRLYDIRDILNQAKSNKETEKYRNLDQSNIDILKQLKDRSNNKNNELEYMIDTINNTSKLNKMSDQELGLDLFDDLKSENNTIISDRNSIKSIIDDVKKQEVKVKDTTQDLDKSFFSASMSFSEEDFEQIQELKKSVKHNSTLLKVILFIIILAITIGAILLVFNLLK